MLAAKRKGQREDMFGNGVEGVVADVGDDDAMRLGVGFVDDIRAGGGDRDQFEIGQLRQRRLAQRHLVDDGDGGVAQALDDLVGRGYVIFLVAVRKVRRPDVGFEGRTVEKHDRM